MNSSLFFGIIILLLSVNQSTQQLSNLNGTTSINNNGGLLPILRSTNSNLLSRLEGPRDRVVNLIKPVVKSDFSRNVTTVLNSLWNRVQTSNISLIQHPLIKTSIVAPINSTLKRLIQITAKEDDQNNTNFEVIDLDNPENARLFSSNDQPSDSDGSTPYTMSAEASNMNEITVERNDNSEREARFLDSYTYEISQDNAHKLFNNVRRNNMRQCFALALCESNCNPEMYSSEHHGRFRNLVNQVESFDLSHEDYPYYLEARRDGRRFFISNEQCDWCYRKYNCHHSRDHLINHFSREENFY